MGVFSDQCNRAGTLSRLRSITLTVDEHTSLTEWQQHVLSLLSTAPLQQFHISTVGGHVGHRLSDQFCGAIVSAHRNRLTRFSVHRMRMSISAIADICRRCTVLQQLFVVVEQNDLVSISKSYITIHASVVLILSYFLGCSRAMPRGSSQASCCACQPASRSWLRGRPKTVV